MTFDQLEYFMSCASCLNFSLAAKYHYVSVSTLSRNISALEAELGLQLFKRGYHGSELTAAGIRFFQFAEKTMNNYFEFCLSMDVGAGKASSDVLKIASYPFDNMFGRIIECFSNFNSGLTGQNYKVHFIHPGRMLDTVRRGVVHIGVASRAELAGHADEFNFVTFVVSGYSLISFSRDCFPAGKDISLEKLLDCGLHWDDFLPVSMLREYMRDRTLSSSEDINALGSFTQRNLPEIIRMNFAEFDNRFMIIPKVIELPVLRNYRRLNISHCDCSIDFCLFCKRDTESFGEINKDELAKQIANNVIKY